MGKTTWKLKKVTPRAMKVLKVNGLLEVDNSKYIGNTIEIFLDDEKLKNVCTAVFDEDFSETDWDDVDLGAVNNGIRNFLSLALGVSMN
jgi:hypothetical protein